MRLSERFSFGSAAPVIGCMTEKEGIYAISSAYTVDGVKINMQIKSAITELVYFFMALKLLS